MAEYADFERAIEVGLDPTASLDLKKQAFDYYSQVRASTDGWQMCLKLFVKSPPSDLNVRFAALGVLEEVVGSRYHIISPSDRATLRTSIWSALANPPEQSAVTLLRTKLAVIVVKVFASQYPTEWPTFFDDLFSLLASASGTPRYLEAVDTFLRVSQALDDEVANLLLQRTAEEAARNTLVKDRMRESAVTRLASAWLQILTESYEADPEIASRCLRLFARYVSWIDINLVVTREFMAGLYEFLTRSALRSAACECLLEIVSKGMKPADKLALLQSMDLAAILSRTWSDEDDEDIVFAEQVAKLVNAIGIELCRCWKEFDAADAGRPVALSLIAAVFPYLIAFLKHEYDDVSSELFPFVASYTMLLKTQKKLVGPAGVLSFLETYQPNLVALLNVIIHKMKYDEEEVYDFGENAGESEALFVEMRKNLKVHFDAVGAIDQDLFIKFVSETVCGVFDRLIAPQQGAPPVSWSEVERALHLLFLFFEGKDIAPTKKTERTPTISPTITLMLSKMVESNVSAYPHVSIPMIYFDNVARYHQFFDAFPQYIPNVLEAFVDARGLHHKSLAVRSRVDYIFLRFVDALKLKLVPFVETVLSSIQDILTVELPPAPFPALTSRATNASSESLADRRASSFDSQLYVFEAVGVLISLENVPPQKQVELLTAVITPLMSQMDETMRKELYKQDVPPDNIRFTELLHHVITAIGSISKGFPDYDHAVKSVQAVPGWTAVFTEALQAILIVLDRLNGSELIRSAARFTFQRLVGCMGPDILAHFRPLLTAGLLSGTSSQEVIDFLPIMCVITHKFKSSISPVLNDILSPLLDRIFYFLNQPVDGTDDAIRLFELRKAYLNYIVQVFNSEVEGVFISDVNAPRLETITQSILHFASDTSDPATQKLAFTVLTKMPKPPLPGFDRFILDLIVPTLFKVPVSPGFSLSDAQSTLVMNEIATLHKAIHVALGPVYVDYLVGVALPGVQCPPHVAQQFVEGVKLGDVKLLRKFLVVCFVEHSGRVARAVGGLVTVLFPRSPESLTIHASPPSRVSAIRWSDEGMTHTIVRF
ncbi:armadillo-type protein [Blyttiomyces helicus]|uniref:Exportin-T n=1 Tax=Blyttiomyces helicus TaxID=388810 RepID=A0A4P9WJM4_9FUNG|nr:armadillo-type protein [Blyttiomyces helicus]|eukprot:RKO91340.1 armadillo-type protein [Blyttiomyces helicus]